MTKRQFSINPAAAVAAVAAIFTGGAVSAQGDLYYLHNASAYYAWSDYDACVADLSAEQCTPTLHSDACGRYLTSTLATRNVALDKLARNETVTFQYTNGDAVYCRVSP